MKIKPFPILFATHSGASTPSLVFEVSPFKFLEFRARDAAQWYGTCLACVSP
jgi:hypothetical protein